MRICNNSDMLMITDLALKGGMCINGILASIFDSFLILEKHIPALKTSTMFPYTATANMLYVNALDLASSEATLCYTGTAFLSSAFLTYNGCYLAAADIFAQQSVIMPILCAKVHDYFNPNDSLVNSTAAIEESTQL